VVLAAPEQSLFRCERKEKQMRQKRKRKKGKKKRTKKENFK
jgi:hypothetical protein